MSIVVSRQLPSLIMLTLVAAFLHGCLASGVYRTARTLGKGEGDTNLTFSATRFSTGETTSTSATGVKTTTPESHIVLPNVIPEVAYHIGITDDLEVGGRAALGSMLLEVDTKYRFLKTSGLHVAVAPALGYRAIGSIEGPSMALPIIGTFDLGDSVALNLAPYISYSSLKTTDTETFGNLSGSFVSAGASMGMQIRGKTAHFMPSVDVSQTLTTLDSNATSQQTSQRFVIISLSMGWVGGREMKKLEQMDEKLDRIDNKLGQDTK